MVEARGRFGRDHDESVRLLEGASDQSSRSELWPLLGTIVGPGVPSAMGPLPPAMAKPLVGPGVCVLTELSAQALTQDSLTLHCCLLKTTLSRTCP